MDPYGSCDPYVIEGRLIHCEVDKIFMHFVIDKCNIFNFSFSYFSPDVP